MLGHIRNPTQHMVSFLGISIYILYGSGIAIFGLVKTTFGRDFSTTNTKQKQLSSDTFLYKNRIQGSDEMRPLRSEDPADLPQQDPRHPDQGEWQEEARLLRVPEEVPEEGGLSGAVVKIRCGEPEVPPFGRDEKRPSAPTFSAKFLDKNLYKMSGNPFNLRS